MAKGGNFERDISKALTRWLSGVEKPYMYWRMPSSGGLATIHEECRGLSGDIRALHPDAEFLTDAFSIECKTGYPRVTFWQLFKCLKNFELMEFWRQACGDAERGAKKPMLVYRKKGNNVIFGISEDDSTLFEELCDDLGNKNRISMRFCNIELPTVVFYDFNEFFDMVTPALMKEFIDGNKETR
jgi:hypothetical protein